MQKLQETWHRPSCRALVLYRGGGGGAGEGEGVTPPKFMKIRQFSFLQNIKQQNTSECISCMRECFPFAYKWTGVFASVSKRKNQKVKFKESAGKSSV